MCPVCCAKNVSHTLPTGTLPTGASYKYIQRRTIAICSRRGHLLARFARPDLPTEPRRWNEASLYGRNGSPAPIILRRQSRCADRRAGKNPPGEQMVSDKLHVKLQWQSVAGAVLFPSCFHLPLAVKFRLPCWLGRSLFVDETEQIEESRAIFANRRCKFMSVMRCSKRSTAR